MKDYSEDTLIEQPAIALFGTLGWTTVNAFAETFGPTGTLGRTNRAEVVLRPRLRAALIRLNPALSAAALDLAIEELTRDRSLMTAVSANRAVYRLLKDGVRVAVRDDEEGGVFDTLKTSQPARW